MPAYVSIWGLLKRSWLTSMRSKRQPWQSPRSARYLASSIHGAPWIRIVSSSKCYRRMPFRSVQRPVTSASLWRSQTSASLQSPSRMPGYCFMALLIAAASLIRCYRIMGLGLVAWSRTALSLFTVSFRSQTRTTKSSVRSHARNAATPRRVRAQLFVKLQIGVNCSVNRTVARYASSCRSPQASGAAKPGEPLFW